MTTPEDIYRRTNAAFAEGHDFSLSASLACLGYVGSHSHGTYVPPTDPDAIDDIDLMGVVIPPSRYLIGLHTFEHWTMQREELDVVTYDFRKFIRLLLKGNPNVLGLLWLREEDYLMRSDAFRLLQEHRRLFAAKSVYASFAGYAQGQLVRMTSYSPEIQKEIDALQTALEDAGWHLQDVMDNRSVPMPKGMTPDEANTKAARLRFLRAKYHAAYMGEKRRGLVVKHGYDTKNAAHLIRLLVMCKEFLQSGELHVYRTNDADMLRTIKRGEWPLDEVKKRAEALFSEVKIERDRSTLPAEPYFDAISDLTETITLRAIEGTA